MKYLTVGAALAAISLFAISAAHAQDAGSDDMLDKDTVVCFQNQLEGDGALTVVGEYFYRRKANAREVEIADGKTACIRYRDAREIKPFFYAGADIEEGKVTAGAVAAECRRTKGGFAKFYVLSADADGKLRCEAAADRDEGEIRENVRGRKAIGG